MPRFTCDLSQTPSAFEHFWEHTVGSDHAPMALRSDWQAQLQTCHAELGFRHVRFHDLLSDSMGTLVRQGKEPIYSFFNADQIMDFLLSIGMRPFIELSFMPQALASGSKTVFRYKANVTPPKNYKQWETFIQKLIHHWVERYGLDEVSQWFFETWNEPNLKAFWTGTRQGYFKLYRHTVEAIKNVDASLKVGGQATAQTAWIEEFLAYCESNHLPVDFVTTHYYPTDAFSKDKTETDEKLANAPPDVMRQQAEKVREQARDLPIYFTEWNISSDPRHSLHDEPFAAAYAAHILMSLRGLVQGYSFWTFSDIFEENYFPSIPFHGGFGLLNLHGIPKPVYRAFQLLHQLGDKQIEIHGRHETVEVWAIRKENKLTLLSINHALPDHSISTETVEITLTNGLELAQSYIQRIDEDHANPRRTWLEMGSPEYLSVQAVKQLQAATELVKDAQSWSWAEGEIKLRFDLPPHGLAAITLEFEKDTQGFRTPLILQKGDE
jgi:xylan 1,4-beta-xylosidase